MANHKISVASPPLIALSSYQLSVRCCSATGRAMQVSSKLPCPPRCHLQGLAQELLCYILSFLPFRDIIRSASVSDLPDHSCGAAGLGRAPIYCRARSQQFVPDRRTDSKFIAVREAPASQAHHIRIGQQQYHGHENPYVVERTAQWQSVHYQWVFLLDERQDTVLSANRAEERFFNRIVEYLSLGMGWVQRESRRCRILHSHGRVARTSCGSHFSR
ncbi:hypothetical protein HYDPIDRAFT_115729 [Hydnomerulius pinastri MD-312]|uniref:F-box domain-containing protein n=1 Tax=Hydnomerulius pinastri MD-312 TaxID=994086 RepID=A0A0C2PR30_9AGAM|nr:hypothetical protein HYDPIDRAFT_120567 [Hydnomerulius pinastri MD-312]KIJ61567.1 hypothetical protein HYDPIDRAFT_115729 [Hydnomerulius pinastri MD-312]